MADPSYDVIVVGAGISGLSAAKCLKEEGLRFIVLESQNRVGGRTYTSREGFGYADMGGAYFGHHQKYVIGLAKELGLEFYNVPVKGKTTMKYKGRISHYSGDIPPSNNIFELLDIGSMVKKLDRLSLEVPLLEPWTAPSASEWDSMTVTEYLDRFCWTSYSRTLLDIGISAVFGIPSKEVSFLYALYLIRSCGGIMALFDQKGGLQEMKLIGGSDSVSRKLSSLLQSEIQFNKRVTQINQDDEGVKITTEDGSTFSAKAVIVAISPVVQRRIKWMPSLPDRLQSFIDLPMAIRPDCKTVTYYKRPFWEEKGLNGSIVSTEGVVRISIPDTKHDGSFPAIMGFVSDEKSQSMSFEDRKATIAKQYAELFGIDEMASPVGYLEKWWSDPEEYQHCGPGVFSLPKNFMTRHRMLWGQPFGRVYFAGSESSTVFRGYMDGGVRSGALATKKILDDFKLTPKRDYSGLQDQVPYKKLLLIETLIPEMGQLLWGSLIVVTLIAVAVAATYF